ncbi:MAG: 16S rRNA (guanine(966)-N(2))-methyltransferase RsmD [Chloroflexi bacterium]|nr:16S rRNA (guanine(966)-N(2))-methyltransferase RsmD [Chloroflexota bacterium]
MRITGGEVRGFRLQTLRLPSLRPTSDRVRVALFSVLDSLGADLSSVLDLYAGTGALGIEALSRGAERAEFVERDARLCRVIQENLSHTGFGDRATVHCAAAERVIDRLQGRYTLVLLDPPYAEEAALADLLRKLVSSPRVSQETVIVVEHSSRRGGQWEGSGADVMERKRYGDTALSFLRTRKGRGLEEGGPA